MSNLCRFKVGLLALLLCSCTGKEDQNVTLVSPLDCRITEDIASRVSVIEPLCLVLPEEEHLASIQKVLIDSNHDYIVMDSRKNVYRFSREGKFISRIGRQGRGPGEYAALMDIALDRLGKNIFLLSLGQLTEFSETGEYINTYPLPSINYDALAPSSSGFFLIVSAPNQRPEDLTQGHDLVHVYSLSEKKVISKFLKRNEHVINTDLFSYSYGQGYFLRPLEGENVLYYVSDDELEPCFKVDFGRQASPEHYALEGNQFDISKFVMSPYYKMVSHYQRTSNVQYFSAIGPDAEIHHFVFNNDGSPLFSWVDKSFKIAPIYAVSSDESFFYFGVDDPQALFDLPEKEKDPMVRAIVGMTMGSDEISKDFPWLVRIAFN